MAAFGDELRIVVVDPLDPNAVFELNGALADAQAKWLLVHSPSLAINDDAIATLQQHLERHDEVGVIAPAFVGVGKTLVPTAHRFPQAPDAMGRRLPAGPDPRADSGPHTAAWVHSPVALLRIAAIRSAGGFDPAYPPFVYADLCARMLEAGHTTVAHPGVAAHLGRLSTLSDAATSVWISRWLGSYASTTAQRRFRLFAALSPFRTSQTRGLARQGWPEPTTHEAQRSTGSRADWRFLLPSGSHAGVISAGEQSIDWLVDDGWCEVVRSNDDIYGDITVGIEATPADVLVIAAGARLPERLDEVVHRDGSVVLTQRRKFGQVGRRHPSRLLRRAGFIAQRRYLVMPDASAPRRYVPLDTRGGLEWYFGAASGRLPFTTRVLATVAARLPGVVARFAGVVLIVATRKPRPLAVLDHLGEAVGEAGDDVVLITSGHDHGSRAVLLPVASSGAPTRAIKCVARPAYNRNTELEAATIAAVRAELGDAQDLVPDVALADRLDGMAISTEQYVGRWTISDQIAMAGAGHGIDLLREAAAATVVLARRTQRSELVIDESAIDQLLLTPLAELAEMVPVSALLRSWVAEVGAATLQHRGLTVPLVRRHYDLGPWNMMCNPIAIVDWELAAPRPDTGTGPAGCDTLYFAKYWLHCVEHATTLGDEQQAFAFMADGQPMRRHHRAAAAVIRETFDALQIDHRLIPALTLHTWIESALYVCARRSSLGAEAGSALVYLETLARNGQRFVTFWGSATQ